MDLDLQQALMPTATSMGECIINAQILEGLFLLWEQMPGAGLRSTRADEEGGAMILCAVALTHLMPLLSKTEAQGPQGQRIPPQNATHLLMEKTVHLLPRSTVSCTIGLTSSLSTKMPSSL